jgi:hypothetical protein
MYYAFTSIAANYIPKALVLAESVKRHRPEIHFSILLAERKGHFEVPESLAVDEWFLAPDLGIPDFEAWAFTHTIVELCTAIKGPYLDQLLARPDCEGVLYFDPDMVVLAPLDGLLAEFDRGSVLLTPHLTAPESSLAAVRDNELAALRHGIFNLGFLGVRADAPGRTFAAWWRQRLLDLCYDEPELGLFTDQRWVDLAPIFFERVSVLRNPGYNVATWNLSRRSVEGSLRDGLLADGQPVVFYHLSGFDGGSQLVMLYKYARDVKGLFELRNWYIREVTRNAALGQIAWSFGTYHDGREVTPSDRRRYRDSDAVRRSFSDPFAGIGPR